jgi:anti-anti-sigma regulatory factor
MGPASVKPALTVFSGEYDVDCKQQWSQELEDLCCEPSVIIDFSDVTSLDATCMAEVLRMHARRQAKGFARETIILGQPRVRRLFDLHKMHDVVNVVESLGDAIGQHSFAPRVQYAFCRSDRSMNGKMQ